MTDSLTLASLKPAPRTQSRATLLGLLNQYPAIFVVLASAIYFAATIYRAKSKLLWFDEIFTFYLSRLPSTGAIWAECRHGNDLNPPLFYLVTRWSQDLFGVNELGTRVPELTGFWIFCLSIYKFVASRATAAAGLIALVYPMTTEAYYYAYEARPHGMVLGFFGIALLSWQASCLRESRRWVPLTILAAALICASLCHCFAFILLVPLGLGELVRTIARRRIDWANWFALVFPAIVSVATVLPLLQASKGFGTAHIVAQYSGLTDPWALALSPMWGLPLFVLIGLAIPAVFPRSKDTASPPPTWKFLAHEQAAIAGILLTPVVAFTAAGIGNSPVFGRYALILCGGVACLIGAAAARSSFATGLVLTIAVLRIAAMALYFDNNSSVVEPSSNTEVSTKRSLQSKKYEWIRSTALGDDPVVIGEALNLGTMFQYEPGFLKSRLVYLIPDGRDGDDYSFIGAGYVRLQSCCKAPGSVEARSAFIQAHKKFYVYARSLWLLSQGGMYRQLGARVILHNCDEGNCLWRVEFPEAAAAPAS